MSARLWGALTATLLLAIPATQAQMPDAKLMSGIPLPSGDVPKDSVSVRVVRGRLDDPVVDHPVELHGGDRTQSARTDRDGRAVFGGVRPGLPVHVFTEVDGEKVESQTFSVPPEAGVRLVLVAGAGAAVSPMSAAPPSAAVPGEILFGGDSRIQIEFDDDTLEVFYLLEIVNASSAPVNPKNELVFELPEGAEQTAMLEGSSTQAAVKGRTVSISGPFAPGTTPIQLAFSMKSAGVSRVLAQTFPITWARVQVIVTKAGAVGMSSPQFTSSSEMPGETQPFLLGVGGALPGGTAFSLSLTGLASRSHVGRYAALAIGLLVLGWGVVAAMSAQGPTGDEARHAQLEERRDRLMADLVRIEQQCRSGTLDAARHQARRTELIMQLERVYGELDEHAGPGQRLPA